MGGLTAAAIKNIGVSGIYFFTVIMAIVLIVQIIDIFNRRSVKTLSSFWIIYSFGAFISGIIYSLSHDLQPVLVNNLTLTVMYGVMTAALFHYRGLSRRDWLLAGGLGLALGLMAASRFQSGWYLAFSLGGSLASTIQLAQLWTERNVGVLSPWMIGLFTVSNVFWSAYGFAVHDLTLSIIGPLNFVIWAIMFASWLKFWRLSRATPPTVIPASARLAE